MSLDRFGVQTAFLQWIESDGSSHFFTYPNEEFYASDSEFDVRIGPNRFSKDQITIDLHNRGVLFSAKLQMESSPLFGEHYHPLNVMGLLSKAPFLPCYHHIIQMGAKAEGSVRWKGEQRTLNSSVVYIEKDWGTSFPKRWNWLQSLKFENYSGSLSAVTSVVPFFGVPVPAGMAAIELDKQRFFWSSAWGHSWKSSWKDHKLELSFKNSKHSLHLSIQANGHAPLIAPVQGEMKRTINESLNGVIDLKIRDKRGNTILADRALQSGVEVVR